VSTVEGRYAAIQQVPPENCNEERPASARAPERAPVAQSLVLVCYGAGTRPTVESQPSYSWDHDRHKWRETDTIRAGSQSYSSDVQIELYGDHGRIHLSDDMVPPLHSGGSNGWWDLSDLVMTVNSITATYRLNGMNKPRLNIDRRTGQLSITGLTEFHGHCDIGDWSGGSRRF
jgi:hypothetical protein